METHTPHPPSPSEPDNALVSPETLGHHSSPDRMLNRMAQTPSIQHFTIEEKRHLPLSVSGHHQLVAMTPPHMSSQTTQTSPGSPPATGHLALLYHTSHHHHMHQMMPIARRPSRLPEHKYVPPKEIRA